MIIYSAMFGGYDKLNPIINNLKFKNFFFITDDAQLKKNYPKQVILVQKKKLSDSLTNRFYKLNPSYIFKKNKFVLYIDSNIAINEKFIKEINAYKKKDKDIFFLKHPYRNNASDELFTLLSDGKISLLKYLNYYNKVKKFKKLFECNTILFNLSSKRTVNFLKYWREFTITKIQRDQIAIFFAFNLVKINYGVFNISNIRSHKYIKFYKHKTKKKFSQRKNYLINKIFLRFFSRS